MFSKTPIFTSNVQSSTTGNSMNRSGAGTKSINTNPAVDARAVKRISKELERIQRCVCVLGHIGARNN